MGLKIYISGMSGNKEVINLFGLFFITPVVLVKGWGGAIGL